MTLSDCQGFWVAFVGKIKSLEGRQVAKEEEKSLLEPVSERLPATTAENLESEQNTQNPTQSISSNGISKKQRKKFYSNKKRQ